MRSILTVIFLIPFLLHAQNEKNYLEGAVPEINNKVVFSKDISVPNVSKDQIYEYVLQWAQERFKENNNRIVFMDKEKGELAALGEEYLVFSRSALSLDRTLISYRMLIDCQDQLCKIQITNIKYVYDVSHKSEPDKYVAETWITDKYALNKGKLNRNNGKFRTKTVDYMQDLIYQVEVALVMSQKTSSAPTESPIREFATATSNSLQENEWNGYRKITPEFIPGNIIKMASQDWMLITAGQAGETNMMTASWGGLGNAFGKPVAFSFIIPTRHTYQLMNKSDTYTLTFYTKDYKEILQYCGSNSGKDKNKIEETGLTPIYTEENNTPAFKEAWLIIECKKLMQQPLTPEFLTDENLKEEWIGKEMHTLFIGEIINVWIK